ncbi:MAG: type II toxin-antitoxin system prevent-host-death family antitoxin [Halobacteriales archaeon]|nr:type II toxin-antitoxin system prevent-host-death family antitoxin [Halobacteriales archaeon]
MRHWLSSEAKQRFSEVVRRSAQAPQAIYRRDRLVAAVISAEDFEEFEEWREERRQESLGSTFDEVREIANRYEYEIQTGERRDRPGFRDESS